MASRKPILHTLAALLFALAAPLQAQGTAKLRVAVAEPKGNASVTSMNKDTVRGALEEGLVATGKYTFLDRTRIDRALQEQGFQRSALADPDTVKRLGRLLGADMVCGADLLKDGGEMNIRVSIIDVESGEIAHSASEYIESGSNAAINTAVRNLVGRMMGAGGVTSSSSAAEKAIDDVIRFWEKTKRLDSSEVFIEGDTRYRIDEMPYDPPDRLRLCVFKGGSPIITIYDTYGGRDATVPNYIGVRSPVLRSIFKSGDDIYVVGQYRSSAVLFKNKQSPQDLSNGKEANYVYVVNGSDVFVAGVGDNGKPILWLNGAVIRQDK